MTRTPRRHRFYSPIGLIAVAGSLLAFPAGASACEWCSWGASAGGDIRERVDAFNASIGPGLTPITLGGRQASSTSVTTQQVWLDFSQQVPGVFTPAMQGEVLAGFEAIYSPFDFAFSLTEPAALYTRIAYDGRPFGGMADELDFRNLNPSNVAFVGTAGLDDFTTSQKVFYGMNVGSHELGHTVGLRHHDSYGPIGTGVPNATVAGRFLPDFPGPIGAAEFSGNVMSSPGHGSDVDVFLSQRAAFSERSLTKLTFNQQGTVISEAPGDKHTIETAQPLTLVPLSIPNTRPPGTEFHGEPLNVSALTVLGSRPVDVGSDFYAVTAAEGDLLIVEAISQILAGSRIVSRIDPLIRIYDETGALMPYYAGSAENDDESETFDSLIMDLVIPVTGQYFIEVTRSPLSADSNKQGNYELYVFTFSIPEPAALAPLLGVVLLLLARRR